MIRSMLIHDLRRNKAIHTALWLLMATAATLVLLSVRIAGGTLDAIGSLYGKAVPPHFIQMHKGELSRTALASFMAARPEVSAWQVDTMIDVEGDQLTVEGQDGRITLSDCRLDIGLVRQNEPNDLQKAARSPGDGALNESRDLLLDEARNRPALQPGQIGMPTLLKEQYGLHLGDLVQIDCHGDIRTFRIGAFLLDAMMNSSMASSTRILLHATDYASIAGLTGESEHLIEVWFDDKSRSTGFRSAYEQAGLPKNGQAVTDTMLFLMSALTDLVLAFVILLASGLMVLAAFVCLRFTLLAALEEDTKQIGTLKAIGFNSRDIRRMYLHKYRLLATLALPAAIALSMTAYDLLTHHAGARLGRAAASGGTLAACLGAALLAHAGICLFCRSLLGRLRRMPITCALSGQSGLVTHRRRPTSNLSKGMPLPLNAKLALREVLHPFGDWAAIIACAFLCSLMMLVSTHLLDTFDSPEFVTYMGSTPSDILLEVENGVSPDAIWAEVQQLLTQETGILRTRSSRRVAMAAWIPGKAPAVLHIDCGTEEGQGLSYLTGTAPKGSGELALSWLNARELGLSVGDSLVIGGRESATASHEANDATSETKGAANDAASVLRIVGIYQDVTSGGYTAKSAMDFPAEPTEKYRLQIDLTDPTQAQAFADRWRTSLGAGIAIDPMAAFSQQTLGGVTRQLRTGVLTVNVFAVLLMLLVTALFFRLRMARDAGEIAITRSIGFTARDIRLQYLLKAGCAALLGMAGGLLLADLIGESLVSAVLSLTGLGLARITFLHAALGPAVLAPCLLVLAGCCAGWLSLRRMTPFHMASLNVE